jgi:signal transduction histidine kinase
VGESCTAALEFGDARDAAELLRAVRAAKEVVQAAVYARDGSPLARYDAPGFDGALPAKAPPLRRSVSQGEAVVVEPVLLRGERIGTMYVRARTDGIRDHFWEQAAFLLALFGAVGAVLGAMLLSSLKQTLTDPLQELARVAAAVRRSGDYSRRAAVRGHAELGGLADALNRMLAAIEERDAELERQRRTLEDAVARRTRELASKTEQLAQAQKIEALGRLAGGIAHDFNNLLAVVIADSRALVDELPEGEHRTCALEIAEAGQRGAALTRQLLAFSRKQVLHPRPVDVADTIGTVSKMLSRLIGEDIRVIVDVRAGHRTVFMDPTQLEQALLNLALNARDAMPGGGTLRFEVFEGVAADAGAGGIPSVCIAVSDTGCGMSTEVASRVFEPFFTTKPQGQGTGLGLAMVHGAVEQSGGHITLESAPGAGTTFRLSLPAMHRVAEQGVGGRHRRGPPRSG